MSFFTRDTSVPQANAQLTLEVELFTSGPWACYRTFINIPLPVLCITSPRRSHQQPATRTAQLITLRNIEITLRNIEMMYKDMVVFKLIFKMFINKWLLFSKQKYNCCILFPNCNANVCSRFFPFSQTCNGRQHRNNTEEPPAARRHLTCWNTAIKQFSCPV